MLYEWELTIPELTGGEMRRAYVYLPDSAGEDEQRRYPVLYMFDGHNVFYDDHATYGKSWGMLEYMEESGTEMIIAAVECNHAPNGARLMEYSPYSFRDPKLGSIPGRGRETMEWLVNVFKPFVDGHFPTLPDRANTFIAGSSMGGLMSLYAVSAYNQVFSRAAALSPSVWCAVRKLNRLFENAPMDPDTVIYMDYGSREINFHPNMLDQFTKVASIFLRRRVALTCRITPGGDHCEACWEKQIPIFMNILQYRDYK